MAESEAPTDRVAGRATRRPRAVLLDVFETVLRVDALRDAVRRRGPARARVRAVLRPHAARRHGADPGRRGAAVRRGGAGRAAHHHRAHAVGRRRSTTCWTGSRELPPHADAEPALMALARARIPVYAFTHGPAEVARARAGRGRACAPTCAGCCPPRRSTRSSRRRGSTTGRASRWTPPPDRTALLAAHSWDVHGAVRAGLVGRAGHPAGGPGARRGRPPARGGRAARRRGQAPARPAGLT